MDENNNITENETPGTTPKTYEAPEENEPAELAIEEPAPMEPAESAIEEPAPMEPAEPAAEESFPAEPAAMNNSEVFVPASAPTYENTYSNNTVSSIEEIGTGWGIASLILGILGLLGDCCYGLGFLFSILSIIFGIIQPKTLEGKKPGTAIAGIICSVIGIIIAIGMWILTFVLAVASV